MIEGMSLNFLQIWNEVKVSVFSRGSVGENKFLSLKVYS